MDRKKPIEISCYIIGGGGVFILLFLLLIGDLIWPGSYIDFFNFSLILFSYISLLIAGYALRKNNLTISRGLSLVSAISGWLWLLLIKDFRSFFYDFPLWLPQTIIFFYVFIFDKSSIKTKSFVEEFELETPSEGVNTAAAFSYKGATIIYKVKIENNTAKPISDIKVYPYIPNVFLLKEKEKSISLIEPKSSQTVTFEIRPTGECGECNVSGRVNYYDTMLMERKDIQLESKSLSIVCPMLRRKEISEDAWREMVSGLVKAEETTTDVPIDGEGLFEMISEILKDINLFMLPPSITEAKQIFRGTARFYGEGVKGLHYAAQIEVVGGAKKSKLILKTWAEKEDALTGFYHGVLDEIEKRVHVKEYIDDSIVQQHIHIGDNIGTQIKDSVVQRSTIGAGGRNCPNCGREVDANEKFCNECGAKLIG